MMIQSTGHTTLCATEDSAVPGKFGCTRESEKRSIPEVEKNYTLQLLVS